MNEKTDGLFDLGASFDLMVERVGGLGKCPMCSHEAWVSETPLNSDKRKTKDVEAPAYVLKTNDMYLSGSPAIPVLAWTCKNCGFLRLHNLQWIKDQMRAGSADE
ncbi:hypothetical protein LUX29_20595 [Aureimonas altamirensis]|uniref:hypothetical protein n=1 Tax=Aureimonas altamirensis TaxID=370622 RepID=UPI001E3C3CF4|nr:hypothetical protein [Aureimonas altamirensis]UHD45362.1 hypothetical protein LUX29_20595 [Aureimonas altamirensis]